MTEHAQIIQGDCCAEMAKLPKASVDMIFADPPYNLQLRHTLTRPDRSKVNGVDDAWDKFESFDHYDRFTQSWLIEARRVLKPNGTIWVIGTYHNIFRLGTMLQNLGFWILNDIIWRKTNPMPNFRGTRFTNAHETLIWAARSNRSKYLFNYRALKTLNDDLQMRSDDWVFPLCTGSERLKDADGQKLHATQKPEALVARTILTATQIGDLILDPFSGTGTTAAAARRLGRRAIGIERESKYIRAARKRVSAKHRLPDAALEMMRSAKHSPRIPFGRIVEEGLIRAGAKLYDKAQRFAAEVRVDGSLSCGRKTGSIHGLAADLVQKESCNGWMFWHYQRNRTELAPIDHLRQEMRARLGALAR